VNLGAGGLILARFLQFAAVIVVFGCGAFRIYGLGGDTAAACPGALAAFDAWYGRVTISGAAVALLSGLILLLAVTANMAGSPVAALQPDVVGAVLFDTDFGRVWSCHLLLTAFLLAACFVHLSRWRTAAIYVLSLLLLISLGLVGHATMHQGATKLGHELNQMVHLLAAGLWLGGLVPLAWLLRKASSTAGISLAREVLPRFSHMGYFAVALLAASGAINAVLLVDSFPALVGTPYGRLLSLKVLLFLAMVTLALINRFRLLPRLCDEPQPSGPIAMLARSVVAEQALGFAVLAVVSVLGTWSPAFVVLASGSR
jgi:putative copper resistance protein D